MISRVRTAAFWISLAAVMVATPVHAAPLTNDTIIRNFNIIAFGNEYTGRRYKHVRKWAKPIRIGIIGSPPIYFEAFVRQHIRDLWELTGFPIELRYSIGLKKAGRLADDFDRGEVNFPLFYLPAADLPKVIARKMHGKITAGEVARMINISTCQARYWTRNNEIVLAYAAFPAEYPREIMRACVVEELTQVLGLVNDSSAVNPSIFNDESSHFELTSHDRLMVRLFYDTRIRVGMPREAAIAAGRIILEEIRPGR